jgi:hypothetical protein
MAFGSAGGAAALAANSLPESPLYPAKLAMEQTRLSATTDPADKATLHLELTQVRVREMERLALAGEVPDEPIILRLRTHLSQAFHLAAELPDDAMLDTLTRTNLGTSADPRCGAGPGVTAPGDPDAQPGQARSRGWPAGSTHLPVAAYRKPAT